MKILFLDIETAPHKVYAWGLWNQDIALNQIEEEGYTLSWAAKWRGFDDMEYRGVHSHGRNSMLDRIHTLVDSADVVVHYNGTKFDMPTLNREFLKEGLPRPSPYKQIDLLKVVRKQFRLPSNKLSYVTEFLGIGQKHPHKGMQLWRDCMAGDAEAWKVMEEYNKQDVVLLEDLYNRLLPWIDGHPNRALYNQYPMQRCNKCGHAHLQKRGFYYTNTYRYQRYQCQNCGTWLRDRVNNVDKNLKQHLLVEAK